jgi:drug/metabolite transporter (DMT)-like permease
VSLGLILPFIKEKLAYPMRGLGVLLLASLSITLYFFLFIGGLQRGMPGAGGVLVTTLNPIVTFAFSLVLNRIWPTKREAIGLGIGVLAGVFLLQLWKQWDLVLSQGNIYFLSATVVWVILSRFTARAKEYSSSATFSFWMYAISTVFTFFLTDTGETIRMMHQADAVFWLNLFFSATITTSIATTFYFYATARIGVNKASSFLFLVPFSAALGAWLFIGEVPQWHTVVGGLLGIVAVYVLTKK